MAIKAGKVTGVMMQRSLDDLSPPECCFSVLFSSFSLDIQCDSAVTRNNWVEALSYMTNLIRLEEAKKAGELTETVQRSMTAAGERARRHTISPSDARVSSCILGFGVDDDCLRMFRAHCNAVRHSGHCHPPLVELH